MDPSDLIRDSFAEGASRGKVLRMLMSYYNLSEEEARVRLDKYLETAKDRGAGNGRTLLAQPHRPPVRDPEQLERDTVLDKALYLVSNISLLIVLFVCVDLLTGFMYYLQDGLDSAYLSSVLPKHHIRGRGGGNSLCVPCSIMVFGPAQPLIDTPRPKRNIKLVAKKDAPSYNRDILKGGCLYDIR